MKVDQLLTEELEVDPELAAQILAEGVDEKLEEIDSDALLAIFESDLAALEADGGKEPQ